MKKPYTHDIFVEKANKIHNNKFDYPDKYVKSNQIIYIDCPKHGLFPQRPSLHLSGQGCPGCANNIKYTNETFVEKANKIHNNRFDYPDLNYINNKTIIYIKCPEHGLFPQLPQDHLKGMGCYECSGKMKKEQDNFIKESKKLHNNKYGYDNAIYIKNDINVLVTCKKHGDFSVTPNNHLNKKSGCPKCKQSNGEKEIEKYLVDNNIKFIYQFFFKDCKYKRCLPFDFYLPDYNLCIEFDGIQHFESIDYFGGEKRFNEQRIKDFIKNNYCNENNIKLIRIKYDDNIIKILNCII